MGSQLNQEISKRTSNIETSGIIGRIINDTINAISTAVGDPKTLTKIFTIAKAGGLWTGSLKAGHIRQQAFEAGGSMFDGIAGFLRGLGFLIKAFTAGGGFSKLFSNPSAFISKFLANYETPGKDTVDRIIAPDTKQKINQTQINNTPTQNNPLQKPTHGLDGTTPIKKPFTKAQQPQQRTQMPPNKATTKPVVTQLNWD